MVKAKLLFINPPIKRKISFLISYTYTIGKGNYDHLLLQVSPKNPFFQHFANYWRAKYLCQHNMVMMMMKNIYIFLKNC